jgi:hypothetical protein
MTAHHIYIPLIPAMLMMTAGLAVAIANPDVTVPIFGVSIARADNPAPEGSVAGASVGKQPAVNVDAKATTEGVKPGGGCKSSASSHASATTSDGKQTIKREKSAHDEGNGCSAHASAKAKVQPGAPDSGDD